MIPEGFDWARLTWLLMALLLVSGAGYGFRRFRFDTRRALLGIAFWAGLLVAIALVYAAFN